MKRIHYLLLGLLVSLTIAATGPGLPPTRLTPGAGIVVATNGVNAFTISSGGTATNSNVNGTFTVNTNRLYVDTARVGIGTTTMTDGTLNVAGIFAINRGSLMTFDSTAALGGYVQTASGKPFSVYAGGGLMASFLSSGNLGIGTNAPTERLHVLGNALIATNLTANDLSLSKTITAPATTGNQTINKAAGRVNIAAAGTTVVVTCSLATANSIIIAVAATADATARVTNVVPAAGSFTINTVATTAETAFNFLIVN